MSFDAGQYTNDEGYPCDCGGSITLNDRHVVYGELGEAPDLCCGIWCCDKCDKKYKQCQSKIPPEVL